MYPSDTPDSPGTPTKGKGMLGVTISEPLPLPSHTLHQNPGVFKTPVILYSLIDLIRHPFEPGLRGRAFLGKGPDAGRREKVTPFGKRAAEPINLIEIHSRSSKRSPIEGPDCWSYRRPASSAKKFKLYKYLEALVNTKISQ